MKLIGPINACGDCPFCHPEGVFLPHSLRCHHPRLEYLTNVRADSMPADCPLPDQLGEYVSVFGIPVSADPTLPPNTIKVIGEHGDTLVTLTNLGPSEG